MKMIFLPLWLKILLLILINFQPLTSSEEETFNETGYQLVIDCISLNLYFDQLSNLDMGLELHELSQNGGPLIISGHSGTGELALFNDLKDLQVGDAIKVFHENYIQEYVINDLRYYQKFSQVIIPNDNTYLYLITCDQTDMHKQLIISAKLAKIIHF